MFQKQHIALLQQIIKDEREAHAAAIAELKSAHAEALSHVINERDRLRDDLDRTRLFLNPGLANVNTSHTPDTSGPPVPADVPVGGAWARVLAREMKKQQEDAQVEESEKRRKAAEIAAKEAPNGGSSEGRQSSSLSESRPVA